MQLVTAMILFAIQKGALLKLDHTPVFHGSTLGVYTSVSLEKPTRARISVQGFGFRKSGIAHLVDDAILFDQDFDAFLRNRGIGIVGIAHLDINCMSICVKLPVFGSITIRLFRKV